MGGESVGGNRALHEAADALPGVFVDDRADLDRSAVLVGVELKVHCPHHVRRVRRRRVDGRGPDALASTPLRDPEPFVTPQALDLLVVHRPPLGAGVVIRPPVPVAGMVLRPGARHSLNARSGSATVSPLSGRRYAERLSPTRRHAIRSLTRALRLR